jgi:hypothetical protein
MDNADFNDVVTSTANGLASGAESRDIAERLVQRFGEEQAFLIFHAARAYLAVQESPPPSGSDSKALL